MDSNAKPSERVSVHSAAVSVLGPEKEEESKGLGSHTIGLILLLCVVCAWTLSNFMGSALFADGTYDKPFFLTYLNTGAFTIVAIPTLVKNVYKRRKEGTLRHTIRSIFSRQALYEFLGRETDSNTEYRSEREILYKTHNNYGILPTTSAAINAVESIREPKETDDYLPLIPTARMAFTFCILWFGANYLGMACLQYTTVASTTILTSTASMWTLIFGTFMGTEKFTWKKLCGVLASFFGIMLISGLDLSTSDTDDGFSNSVSDIGARRLLPLFSTGFRSSTKTLATDPYADKTMAEIALGDALALASAVIYGIYTIVLKRKTVSAHPQELHMPTFFGLVGTFNLIVLFPLFPILHFTNIEPFAWPPTKQVWIILLSNAVCSMSSDVMWAYAMLFTSPLVVTVGLSLNIPLSLVGEMFIQDRYEGWLYWIGALIVVGSFVSVEREEVKEEQEIKEEIARRSLEASLVLGNAGGSLFQYDAECEDENGSRGGGPSVRQGKQRAKDDEEMAEGVNVGVKVVDFDR